ncbi:hypothetical protein [Sphingopyxis sp. SCN 67-31]|uniref:hypothetical protein n=1 Tax=Sphingopyxis sp. SCN 67-31 TaxID=1660142 RepID=UPI00257AE484|nr:hypothetical protein [Sphingopyxis sp. SCN 67-31]
MPEYGKRRRFAIVTYDPDKVCDLDWRVDAPLLGQQIVQGLRGTAYAKERGLINITLLDQVAPNARPWDAALRGPIRPPLRSVGGCKPE